MAGIVRDAQGLPLSGVSVYLYPASGGSSTYDNTGDDGRFQFLAPAGTLADQRLQTGIPQPALADDHRAACQHKSGIQFGQPLSISGAVRDPGGVPVANVEVEALANSCYGDSDYTSASGEYSIAVDEAATYLVKAGGERRLASVPPTPRASISPTEPIPSAARCEIRPDSPWPARTCTPRSTIGGRCLHGHRRSLHAERPCWHP